MHMGIIAGFEQDELLDCVLPVSGRQGHLAIVQVWEAHLGPLEDHLAEGWPQLPVDRVLEAARQTIKVSAGFTPSITLSSLTESVLRALHK